MNLRANIKAHTEWVPVLLMLLNGLCFYWFVYFRDSYNDWASLNEHFIGCSLFLIIILYGHSDKWGFVAKRSLLGLCVLWTSNLYLLLFGVDNMTYLIVYQNIIFMAFLGIILRRVCNRW